MKEFIGLENQRIMVTGASSGIGKETSILLSELGANLILVARNREQLEFVKEKLSKGDHSIYVFDLDQTEQIPTFLKNVSKEVEPLSGIFHAAGIDCMMPISMVKEKHIERTFRVSVYAAMMLARGLCSKGVRKNGSTSFVVMSSVSALMGAKALSVYAASKSAVDGMVRSLAIEFADKQIRVNSIVAGLVNTAMLREKKVSLTEESFTNLIKQHPLGIGEPRDIAMAAAFLLSDASKWITGTTLVVDGGFSTGK